MDCITMSYYMRLEAEREIKTSSRAHQKYVIVLIIPFWWSGGAEHTKQAKQIHNKRGKE